MPVRVLPVVVVEVFSSTTIVDVWWLLDERYVLLQIYLDREGWVVKIDWQMSEIRYLHERILNLIFYHLSSAFDLHQLLVH